MKLQLKPTYGQNRPTRTRRNLALALTLALLALSISLVGWRTQAARRPIPPTASAVASNAIATTISDFNGTGFEFEAASWSGSVTTGPTAVTIDRFATERGIGGFAFSELRDFTGMGIALTAQWGAGNEASSVQVRLIDDEGDAAIFEFPASSFNATTMTTVFLPSPTFTTGPVNVSQVRMVWVSGNFASENRFVMSIDKLATVSCTNNLVVTTTADSGEGSLRDAIAIACAGSTITFASNVTGEIALSSGQLEINKDLTILGPGAQALTVRNTKAPSTTSRVLYVASGTVNISGLTFTGGQPNGTGFGCDGTTCGGGISNLGSLTLTNCVVTGNSIAGIQGGGIYNRGTLTLSYSTVSNNSNSGDYYNYGGGIYSEGGTINLLNSTVTGNTASGSIRSYGGGIFSYSGTLRMTNSTISGNRVINGSGHGAGILCTNGNLIVTNCTITNNSANGEIAFGGGIMNTGTLQSRNTIIAGNTVSGERANQGPDVWGTLDSQGFNLIGNTTNTTITGDQIGNIYNQPAQLAPLANNGGPTQTHALLTNSPARDAGDNCVLTNTCASPNPGFALTTDQRGTGFNRLVGDRVDIGAFEFVPTNTAPSISAIGISRGAGNPGSVSQIASVYDTEDAESALNVTASPLSGSGVTISGISVNSSGHVTANVAASCGATDSTFTLRVTDSETSFNEATLTVTVNPETTPPTINPINNVVVSLPLNSPATSMVVNFPLPTATDNCTANPTVTTLPASGSTFPVGTTTVIVTAKDGAMNQATSSFTVTVRYNFGGFFQPVDNAPIVNTVSAGQSIPVKFSLSGNKGLSIFAAGFPQSAQIACSGSAADDIEETVTAGGSSLSYDATTDQYKYVWKTEKAWKGTCRKLILRFNDGTTREALFQFK